MPRFDVFGRIMTVSRRDGRWESFLEGADGTRRDALIRIPDSIPEAELARHLADVFHESATPRTPDVVQLD